MRHAHTCPWVCAPRSPGSLLCWAADSCSELSGSARDRKADKDARVWPPAVHYGVAGERDQGAMTGAQHTACPTYTPRHRRVRLLGKGSSGEVWSAIETGRRALSARGWPGRLHLPAGPLSSASKGLRWRVQRPIHSAIPDKIKGDRLGSRLQTALLYRCGRPRQVAVKLLDRQDVDRQALRNELQVCHTCCACQYVYTVLCRAGCARLSHVCHLNRVTAGSQCVIAPRHHQAALLLPHRAARGHRDGARPGRRPAPADQVRPTPWYLPQTYQRIVLSSFSSVSRPQHPGWAGLSHHS